MVRPKRKPQPKPWPVCCTAFVLLVFSIAAAPPASGQSSSDVLNNLPTPEQVIKRNQDTFLGSIPQGKPTAAPLDLSIEDALQRGLKYNLGLYLSQKGTQQAQAAHLRSLSEILPNINGSTGVEEQRINLAQFGFTAPFPSAVGPFGIYDLRATGSWNVLDLHSIDNVRAATQNVQSAQFTYRDARDTVVLAVGANYLLTIAQESRVAAAQAELKTAQALYQLAVDQETAGLAPNVDTLRAKVQLQVQQEALILANNDMEKQRIALARTIGLPVTQKFRLVNRVPYHPLPPTELESAYSRALQTRSDYQASLASLRAAQLSRDAAWKQHLPSIGFGGEYGILGNNLGSLSPNWSFLASLRIPIFQGGKIEADVRQADAVLQQRQAQVDDLKAHIEQDIEDALLDLRAAEQQIEVARTGLEFATQALAQSQDRFAAGVTNNVEVIQAQQQLASANDRYIASLYAHNISKVLLARAIGNAEDTVKVYLSQPGNVTPDANPPAPGTPPDHAAVEPPGTPLTDMPRNKGTLPLGTKATSTEDYATDAVPSRKPAPVTDR